MISNEQLDRARRELNFLYTEPPFPSPSGVDFGLFCREHALHTYILLHMYGCPVNIILGSFYIRSTSGHVNIGTETGTDHAWCSTSDLCPLDLSMTFSKAHGYDQLDEPVLKTGFNGPYQIHYARSPQDLQTVFAGEPHAIICYMESGIIKTSPQQLLDAPFTFLFPPVVKGHSLVDDFGADIFARITYHVYMVCEGRRPPLYRYYKGASPIGVIKSKYSNCRHKVLSIIENKK